MVIEDVKFRNTEFIIQYIQEFALNPADISLAKDTGHGRPLDIDHWPVICVLGEAVSTQLSDISEKAQTLEASTRAPRNTRSCAHFKVWISKWGCARSM